MSSTISNSPYSYVVPYSTSDLIGNENSVYTPNKSGSNSSTSTTSASGSYSQGLVSQMSGLDVGKMANEMLASDQVQLDKLYAKQQTSQWKQDIYRSIIDNLQHFQNKYFDQLSSDYIFKSDTFLTNSAKSSDEYDVSATALNSAKAGTYTITSATLATSANVTTTLGSKPPAGSSLSSLGIQSGVLHFTANGRSVSYNLNNSVSINTAMQDLSSLSGMNFNYSELTGKFSISTSKTGSNQNVDIEGIDDSTAFFSKFGMSPSNGVIATYDTATISGTNSAKNSSTGDNAAGSDKISDTNLGLSNGAINFSVNGTNVSYTLDTSKTINQVVQDLSAKSGATFSYDSFSGKFNVETTGGQTLDIKYTNTDANTENFFSKVIGGGTVNGSTTDITQTSHSSKVGTAGTDGTFTIKEPGDTGDGVSVTKSSNIFTIDGVQYNISSAISSSSPVTINVKQDVSSAVDKIQEFVNEYNDLIGGIQTIINQKTGTASTGGKYSVLTLAQEQGMTSDQIAKWNQKAQQGLFSSDGLLVDMTTAMRTAFYTPVTANNLTMNGIGLSTSTKNYTDYGKITINASQLTTALQNNPQEVVDLLTKASSSTAMYTPDLSSTQLSARNSEEGIFQRISDIINEYAGTYVDKNGNQGKLIQQAGCNSSNYSDTKNAFYKQLKDEQDAIATFKTKMSGDKKMYTNKFTALQSALSTLSSQSNYLSSMLGMNSNG